MNSNRPSRAMPRAGMHALLAVIATSSLIYALHGPAPVEPTAVAVGPAAATNSASSAPADDFSEPSPVQYQGQQGCQG